MKFDLEQSIEILERTPEVLRALLQNLSPAWTLANEGPETWSPYDVVGHLIVGEKTDWMPRLQVILSGQTNKNFPAFDRFAQFQVERKTLPELLEEFAALRKENVEKLRAKQITTHQLGWTGTHPAFGTVTLAQLLATWVAHDLNHLAQISRVMAKQYREEVGPWIEYLRVLKS